MVRLFEKARRWYEVGTDEYGDVCLLQVSKRVSVLYAGLLTPVRSAFTKLSRPLALHLGPLTHPRLTSPLSVLDQAMPNLCTAKLPQMPIS